MVWILGVSAIAIEGTNVYVGGAFTTAIGYANTAHIARWEHITSTWHSLGGGLNYTVRTIAVEGANVYAGGDFMDAGGLTDGDHIARWDSALSTWNPLDDGLGHNVYTITVAGPNIYVGGFFTDAGGNDSSNYITLWDTHPLNPGWSVFASDLTGPAYVVTVVGTDVYVGGEFSSAGGVAHTTNIALWDGSAWHALGDGLNGAVYAISVLGPFVYAGGYFTDAGTSDGDRIAYWDGENWNPMGKGLSDVVRSIAVVGDSIYAGGGFTVDGVHADVNYIARWWEGSWHQMESNGSGVNGIVSSLAVSGKYIYVGGYISNVGGNVDANYIARWNTITMYWEDVGGGLDDTVMCLLCRGSGCLCRWHFQPGQWGNRIHPYRTLGRFRLEHVGVRPIRRTLCHGPVRIRTARWGSFTGAGGMTGMNHIARWDGSNWNTMKNGLNNNVTALAVVGPQAIAGGAFTDAGGYATANYIAIWTEINSVYLPLTIKP